MKKRSFDFIHNLVEEYGVDGGNGVVSTGTGPLFFKKLREGNKVEEDTTEEDTLSVPFSSFVNSAMQSWAIDRVAYNARQTVKRIMLGQRPRFWESWAHKSTFTSQVVEDYPEAEYVKKFLTRSNMQLVCALKDMAKKVSVPMHSPSGLILLNAGRTDSELHGYFSDTASLNYGNQVLQYLWGCNNVRVLTTSTRTNFKTELSSPDLSKEDTTYKQVYSDYLESLFKTVMKPAHKAGGYSFYIVKYSTLLLAILHDRFPTNFPLTATPEFLMTSMQKIPKKVISRSTNLVADGVHCLFISSDNILQRRALNMTKYKTTYAPRLDINITTKAALEAVKKGKGIKKIDNKVFFDYNRFFEGTINKREQEYIVNTINLRTGENCG